MLYSSNPPNAKNNSIIFFFKCTPLFKIARHFNSCMFTDVYMHLPTNIYESRKVKTIYKLG
jgi:hypothetical protein